MTVFRHITTAPLIYAGEASGLGSETGRQIVCHMFQSHLQQKN